MLGGIGSINVYLYIRLLFIRFRKAFFVFVLRFRRRQPFFVFVLFVFVRRQPSFVFVRLQPLSSLSSRNSTLSENRVFLSGGGFGERADVIHRIAEETVACHHILPIAGDGLAVVVAWGDGNVLLHSLVGIPG